MLRGLPPLGFASRCLIRGLRPLAIENLGISFSVGSVGLVVLVVVAVVAGRGLLTA